MITYMYILLRLNFVRADENLLAKGTVNIQRQSFLSLYFSLKNNSTGITLRALDPPLQLSNRIDRNGFVLVDYLCCVLVLYNFSEY